MSRVSGPRRALASGVAPALALGLVLFARSAGAAPPPSSPPERPRLSKLGRVLALEDRRTAGDGELQRYLQDPDRGLRRRAVLAAGRIGDPGLVGPVAELLNDAEPEVRQMAAFALGLIGDGQAVERLLAALKDPEPVVRGRAAEALGRIGDVRAAAEVARLVVESAPRDAVPLAVRGDDPGTASDPWLAQRLALFGLARLKDARAAETALLVGGRPRFDWWAATYAAMRLESPSLRPVLVAAASSSDPLSRALAARGLGALKDASALDVLTGLLRDKEPDVVVNAVRALAALGDGRATPAVAPLLRAPSPVLTSEALLALAALPPDRGLRATVVGLIGHADPVVRGAALSALAHMDGQDFALVLSGLDPDPVWSVRAAMATGLGSATDEVSQGILISMLKDEDPRVVASVLPALIKARGAQALPEVRRRLDHPDVAVRTAAAEAVTALKATGLSAALLAAYKRSMGEDDLEARLAQIAALAVQKDPPAIEALRQAAQADPSRAARQRAAAALRGLGQPAPDVGPEPVERPAFDYEEAMAPYDPVPGLALYTPRALLHTVRGTIEIHLNVVEAPLTSASFIDLARRGFFDGLTFHRVVPGFVIQGGDPHGDGNGGPGYTLRCEVGQRPYGRGGVGMALSGKDTGGSQFFITLTPQPRLDGDYTLFGWVAQGMEVVEQIRPGDVIQRVEVWTGP